jgi:hypothetical protein
MKTILVRVPWTTLLLVCTMHVHAQGDARPAPFPYPELPAQVVDSAVVSEGWHRMQVASGDPGFAIVLEFHAPVLHMRPDSTVSQAPPRILGVYRRTPAGAYVLEMQSNTFLLRADEGGMTAPELDLRFHADTLHVSFQFLRGNLDYAFLQRAGQLTCVAFTNAGVVMDREDDLRMDLVRDVAVHRQGPVDQQAYDTEERLPIPAHPPLTLEHLAMPMRTQLRPGLVL